MTKRIDLLITNASQVCVVPSANGGPQRGKALGTLGIVENGAVAVDDGRILEVGASSDLRARYDAGRTINADGKAIVPGFVDPHTHLAWVGDRAAEFEQRIAGATYMEIMAAGGGINSTVRQVRGASVEQLVNETWRRLDRMLRNGTTTIEIKTGYGLDTASELKMLDAIFQLAARHPATVVPTFMGAHAVPPEYDGRTDAFVDVIVNEMTPAVAERLNSYSQGTPVFVDVFCEPGAFDLAQSRRVLEAGLAHGMRAKLHADEFASIGGAWLAVELGATSADHLVTTPEADIAALGQADTVAVALPATPFGLGHTHYTPARALSAAGAVLALATDCNPGTAWCESMPFVMALACRYLRITPAEALAAATLNAAYAVGLGERMGSLETGKQADALILTVSDYRHLAYRFGGNLVQTVIKGGQVAASL